MSVDALTGNDVQVRVLDPTGISNWMPSFRAPAVVVELGGREEAPQRIFH